jgi:hypothetical protein
MAGFYEHGHETSRFLNASNFLYDVRDSCRDEYVRYWSVDLKVETNVSEKDTASIFRKLLDCLSRYRFIKGGSVNQSADDPASKTATHSVAYNCWHKSCRARRHAAGKGQRKFRCCALRTSCVISKVTSKNVNIITPRMTYIFSTRVIVVHMNSQHTAGRCEATEQ